MKFQVKWIQIIEFHQFNLNELILTHNNCPLQHIIQFNLLKLFNVVQTPFDLHVCSASCSEDLLNILLR
jgi:hypothetical protein